MRRQRLAYLAILCSLACLINLWLMLGPTHANSSTPEQTVILEKAIVNLFWTLVNNRTNCSRIRESLHQLVYRDLPINISSGLQPPAEQDITTASSEYAPTTDSQTNLLSDFTRSLIGAEDLPPRVFNSNNKCQQYFMETRAKRQTYANVIPAWGNDARRDVCLVTHLSDSRLDKLTNLVDKWQGPMSVSIYTSRNNYVDVVHNVTSWLTSHNRLNVAVHLTVQEGKYYPVNYLRNVAMQYSNCSHHFILDVDYLPNEGLYESLQKYIPLLPPDERRALIIPAFETLKSSVSIPRTKPELLDQWDKKQLSPFHVKNSTRNAHASTNYSFWRTTTEVYNVTFKEGYEPYIVISRSVAPPFIDLFLHRYGNKVSYFVELNARGFIFQVAPNAFVVHTTHPTLASKEIFKEIGPCTGLVFKQLKEKIKQLRTPA